MIKGYEIERKFLVEFPDISKLNLKNKVEIYQTYLKNEENETQRRVRKMTYNNVVKYTYTEKLFITSVTRREMEYEILETEYLRLLTQARDDCVPIDKIRYYFEFKNQIFELDTYPFSTALATMEIELDNPEQNIEFPDNVTIIKEVTGDSRYANAELAKAGAFPI